MTVEQFPSPLDKHVICTSSTRPGAGAFEGLQIYETDTDRVYIYNGTAWIYQYGGLPLYSARAYRNAAFNIPAASSITIIPFDTEVWDRNNNFDTSTGRYTVPVVGDYQVDGTIDWNLNNNPEVMAIHVYLNGASHSVGGKITVRNGTAGDDYVLTVSALVAAAAGDLIDIRASHSVGGNVCALTVAPQTNYMNVCKVA